jgi:hypothetical protein
MPVRRKVDNRLERGGVLRQGIKKLRGTGAEGGAKQILHNERS